MKQVFKQIIIDFQETPLPQARGREFQLPGLPAGVRKAFVLIGMRRSGKTWSLYQHMQHLLQNGVQRDQILYINFEDDRLVNLTVKDLQSILDAYYELFPQYIDNKNLHFFFDEIHEILGWEKFIRRLLDAELMTIYISGSSAKLLSKEIATTLRGRAITREIFPFDFKEYLHFKNIVIPEKISSKQKALFSHHVKDFLRWGGFPETIHAAPALHREILQDYIEIVVYRDIVQRHKISNAMAVKRLLIYCLQNSAALFSVNKLYNSFKSMGIAISKNSLYEFMEFFADAYCIFNVPLYHFSSKKTILASKKIYPVDQGMITAYTIKQNHEEAARLETAVFAHLRHHQPDIYYYHTESNQQIDFLTVNSAGEIALYQSSLTLADPETKTREVNALRQAMSELNVNYAVIITLDEEEQITVDEGVIDCIPAWRFLLHAIATSDLDKLIL